MYIQLGKYHTLPKIPGFGMTYYCRPRCSHLCSAPGRQCVIAGILERQDLCDLAVDSSVAGAALTAPLGTSSVSLHATQSRDCGLVA